MEISEREKELTRSLSIALRKKIEAISEEELLDIMVNRLQYAGEQKRYRNHTEARYTENTAEDIKNLLKLRIGRIRKSS